MKKRGQKICDSTGNSARRSRLATAEQYPADSLR
jgi:hypothetical protein